MKKSQVKKSVLGFLKHTQTATHRRQGRHAAHHVFADGHVAVGYTE